MTKTIGYYDLNADDFYQRSIEPTSELLEAYRYFLEQLPEEAKILDAGCGVGRDGKHFSELGYMVTAFDASEGMVNYTKRLENIEVRQLQFSYMAFEKEFDGVWAYASLIHVPYIATRDIFQKIHAALKDNGIFFASYKYGEDHMPTDERDFYNMTEETIMPFLEDNFEVIKVWKSDDTRSKVSPSAEKSWLNLLARAK